MILYFRPVKGLIGWTNKSLLYQFLLDNEGKECYANLGKIKNIRSLSQNAFMWKYLEIIAEETGNSAEDLHRIFKGLFLPKKEITFKGKKYMMSGSTTELSKGEMTMYLDKICGFTQVPFPNEQTLAIAYPQRDESNTPTI